MALIHYHNFNDKEQPLDKETPVFIHSFHGFVLSVKSWYFSGFVNEMQTAHDNPTYKNQLFQGYW